MDSSPASVLQDVANKNSLPLVAARRRLAGHRCLESSSAAISPDIAKTTRCRSSPLVAEKQMETNKKNPKKPGVKPTCY